MEFNALRSELLARSQTTNGVIATAVTVLAAIGGFALSKEDGRTEMLLVLPLILSGLAILWVDGSLATRRMGHYMREHLATRLGVSSSKKHPCPTWEHYIEDFRRTQTRRLSVYLATGTTPVLLIFVAPSVASLIITWDEASGPLAPLWYIGLVSILLLFGVSLSLRVPAVPASTNAEPASTARLEED